MYRATEVLSATFGPSPGCLYLPGVVMGMEIAFLARAEKLSCMRARVCTRCIACTLVWGSELISSSFLSPSFPPLSLDTAFLLFLDYSSTRDCEGCFQLWEMSRDPLYKFCSIICIDLQSFLLCSFCKWLSSHEASLSHQLLSFSSSFGA